MTKKKKKKTREREVRGKKFFDNDKCYLGLDTHFSFVCILRTRAVVREYGGRRSND